MKWGLEIRESHSFETHLNLISDFTGSRERMSVITPFGSRSDMEEESGYSQSQCWREEMKSALSRGLFGDEEEGNQLRKKR